MGATLGKTTGWIHRLTLRQRGVHRCQGGLRQGGRPGLHVKMPDGAIQIHAVDHVVVCAGQLSHKPDGLEHPNMVVVGGRKTPVAWTRNGPSVKDSSRVTPPCTMPRRQTGLLPWWPSRREGWRPEVRPAEQPQPRRILESPSRRGQMAVVPEMCMGTTVPCGCGQVKRPFLNGFKDPSVLRVPSGNTNTLRPFFRVWVKVLTALSDEVRLPRSTKMVPANSLIFPSKGTFRMLALLKNTMGVGLAANAALMSRGWCGWPQAQVPGWIWRGPRCLVDVHFCGHPTHASTGAHSIHGVRCSTSPSRRPPT